MKIFNFYSKNNSGIDVDRTWFDSSNIKYSECLDYDNKLKTLNVVFNNGTQYEYTEVNAQDYLFFRDSPSQGKALNEYIKGKNYSYKKIENVDIETINNELEFRINGGIFVTYDNGAFEIKDNKDKSICGRNVKLTKDAFDTICSALSAVGKELYTEGKGFVDENDKEYASIKEEMPF